jgi:UPF0042 nucleotide-binding protein
MRGAFATEADAALRVSVVSFGFKYGLPLDADMVADCRFLPNPHWVPELAPLTGQDRPVVDYVLSQPGATEFLDAFVRAVEIALAGYDRTGRHFVLLAVGCTGGKHRSVAVADEMAARLSRAWPGIEVTHRDLGRE